MLLPLMPPPCFIFAVHMPFRFIFEAAIFIFAADYAIIYLRRYADAAASSLRYADCFRRLSSAAFSPLRDTPLRFF